jgi:hypothetical protein
LLQAWPGQYDWRNDTKNKADRVRSQVKKGEKQIEHHGHALNQALTG